MKIDRLISIIMILLERDRVSGSELAEMFEVSLRTIYRDIETINQAGIPVISYTGKNGGVEISKGYKVDKRIFSKDDISSLLIGLSTIRTTLPNEDVLNTIAKVKGFIPQDISEEIQRKSNQMLIDLSGWSDDHRIRDYFVKIKKAIGASQLIQFGYTDANGNTTTRTVEPYTLILKDWSWYVKSYCLDRQSFRTFKLGRMTDLVIVDKLFHPRSFILDPASDPLWDEKPLINLELIIHKSIKYRLEEWCGAENISPYDEDHFLAKLTFPEDEWVYSFILGWGNDCEVLAPLHAREKIISIVQSMYQKYL